MLRADLLAFGEDYLFDEFHDWMVEVYDLKVDMFLEHNAPLGVMSMRLGCLPRCHRNIRVWEEGELKALASGQDALGLEYFFVLSVLRIVQDQACAGRIFDAFGITWHTADDMSWTIENGFSWELPDRSALLN